MRSVHQGNAADSANAEAWSSAISATTGERVFVRGVPLDQAIGMRTFADVVFRLWTGREGTRVERDVLDACLVAAVDQVHSRRRPRGPHGRHDSRRTDACSCGRNTRVRKPPRRGRDSGDGAPHRLGADEDPTDWATRMFERERAAGRRVPGSGTAGTNGTGGRNDCSRCGVGRRGPHRGRRARHRRRRRRPFGPYRAREHRRRHGGGPLRA